MQTEEKNNETKRGRTERRNCLRKCFHSFKYVMDHANVRFFSYVDSLHCFVRFRLYYLLHLFSSDRFAALASLQPYKFLIWICEFFKNHPRRVFCNVNLSNLESLLQGNLEEKILKIFRLAANEWHLRGLDVNTGRSTQKNSGYVTTFSNVSKDCIKSKIHLVNFKANFN